MRYAALLLLCASSLFLFGCFNYTNSVHECGTDLYCFEGDIERGCSPSVVQIEKPYGTVELHSNGVIWTAIFDHSKNFDCRVTVSIKKINESTIPAEQKKMLSDLNVPISTLTIPTMECIMTDRTFHGTFISQRPEYAKEMYSTCAGPLKEIMEKVPAIKEFTVH